MKTENISIDDSQMTYESASVLEGYWVVNTVPEALAIAVDEFLNDDKPFIIDKSEISPLEMLEIVLEILNAYNKEVAK